MLKNIQVLRAFAALSVLTFHFSFLRVSALPLHPGAFGVDLFFVLSGFIIAYSAERKPRHFLQHRLIRVLPPYWVATCLGLLIALVHSNARATLLRFGESLLFTPLLFGRDPIIFVAWTLVYELAFYLLYSLCLWLSRIWAPVLCLSALMLLALGAYPVGPPLRPWPLLLEFALGLGVFLVFRWPGLSQSRLSAAALPLVSVGLILLYALPGQGEAGNHHDELRRVLLWGLPASLVVLGTLLWERRGVTTSSRVLLMLGNASYALYLLHPLLMSPLSVYASGSVLARIARFCLITVATMVFAVGFYAFVEAPLLRWLRHRLLHDRAPVIAQPVS